MNRRGKTKEGFLHVKQPSRFGKAWKRKWVVIRPNTTKGSTQGSVLLELYLEKGAYNKTVTSLLLEGITAIRRILSKSQPRAFEFVKSASNVALTLAAESEADAQEWMEIFKKLLLPATEQKELTSIAEYGSDVFRLSVVPNKDSDRLALSGVYLAGISRLQVVLHQVITGEKVLEWDLRHIKRFMLPSKGPQQDLEKIACLQISNRSPQGQGEYLFFSARAKAFVETIYERLSSAITVKERRSRTSSMLFEIPPKELELLAKAIQEGGDPGFVMVGADGGVEGSTLEDSTDVEEQNGNAKTNGDVKATTNGDGNMKENENTSVGENGDASAGENGGASAGENGDANVGESENASTGENGNTEENNVSEVTSSGTSESEPKEEVQEDSSVQPETTDSVEISKETGVENTADSNVEHVTSDGKTNENETTESEKENENADINEEKGDNIDPTKNVVSVTNEQEESVEDAPKEQLTEATLPESETASKAGDDHDSSAPPTHDVATEPIDEDEDEEQLSASVSEVTPRMPPVEVEMEAMETDEDKSPSGTRDSVENAGPQIESSGVSAEQMSADANVEKAEEPTSAKDDKAAYETNDANVVRNVDEAPADETKPDMQDEVLQNEQQPNLSTVSEDEKKTDVSLPSESPSQDAEPINETDVEENTSSLENETADTAPADAPAAEVVDVSKTREASAETTESEVSAGREPNQATEDTIIAESASISSPESAETEQNVSHVSKETEPTDGGQAATSECVEKEATGEAEGQSQNLQNGQNETTEDSAL